MILSVRLFAPLLLMMAPLALAHFPAGTPDASCTGPSMTHDYGAPAARVGGPATDGCRFGGDTEKEYMIGGAVLAVDDAALTCWGIAPHHPAKPTVHVADVALQGDVRFMVTADWAPEGEEARFPCGDNVVDPCDPEDPLEASGIGCNPRDGAVFVSAKEGAPENSVVVPFAPGQSGVYVVLVGPGTQGHVWTT